MAAPLDTSLVLVSPENIAFEYRLAGPAPRPLAFLIDLLLLGLLALGAGLVFGFVGQGSLAGFYLAGLFFLWWGGNAAVEVLANGQTPGKRALGIRVVSHDGLSINVSQSILRNLLRAVDLAPPFFPGVVSMVVTPRLQRLGDLASGTIVVVDRRAADAAPPVVDTGPNFVADMVPAGLRLGWALLDTRGWSSLESLQRTAPEALATSPPLPPRPTNGRIVSLDDAPAGVAAGTKQSRLALASLVSACSPVRFSASPESPG